MRIKKRFLILLACLLCLLSGLFSACNAPADDGSLDGKQSGVTATYTITYNVVFDGASIDRLSQEVKYGENFTLPKPTYSGLKFKHWVLDGTKEVVNDGVYTWENNVTLKAVWVMDSSDWSDLQ